VKKVKAILIYLKLCWQHWQRWWIVFTVFK
jgi:hypothetical protein